MRPGQQNKRGRGRNNNNNNNNNNRKGGNPLSRTYDSSGPDVKIRGTAQHIAEKYSALARDAQGSSDNVMAENYFQHAEHYNRIIAAAQAQMQERYERDNAERDNTGNNASGNNPGGQDDRDDRDRQASDRFDQQNRANGQDRNNGRPRRANGHDRTNDQPDGDMQASGETAPAARSMNGHVNGSGPQPEIEGTPAEMAMEENSEAPSPRRRAAARPRRQPRKADAGTEDEAAPKPARTRRPKADTNGSAAGEQGADDVSAVVSTD